MGMHGMPHIRWKKKYTNKTTNDPMAHIGGLWKIVELNRMIVSKLRLLKEDSEHLWLDFLISHRNAGFTPQGKRNFNLHNVLNIQVHI